MNIQKLDTYSDLELALMVVLGYFGNGNTRKARLGARYSAVQAIVEQIVKGTVPAGSGRLPQADKIKDAVKSVFIDIINELSEEIRNELE